jgi:transposase
MSTKRAFQKSAGRTTTAGRGKRDRKGKGSCVQDRPILEPNAAGIDIGAREIYVAVPPDRDAEPVRIFKTFTEDLKEMAQWLVSCGVTTVAMESTGVYWIPVYDVIEEAGICCCLVDARGMKNVPGRRTDWHECQWIQILHASGLLRAAFRPEEGVRGVRTMMRHRCEMVGMVSQHVQHMHKALTQMNVQIHHVISDITGVTGLAIVDAILAGERDAKALATLRNARIRASAETIEKSLIGTWREEHLFTLKQSRESYRHYREQIEKCDEAIQKKLAELESRVTPEKALPPDEKKRERRRKQYSNDQTGFDLRQECFRLFGVDLTQIPGLMTMVLMLFSELGRDMSRWPTAGHFVSWLQLCPDNDISGGRVLWRGVRRAHNRAGQYFRMAAYTLHRDESPLGRYLRRMKSKMGPEAATTATAHKLAIIFYTMVKHQVEYDPGLWAARDAQRDQRLEAQLKRQAQQRGYKLVPLNESTAA